jgi:hypothetical protein
MERITKEELARRLEKTVGIEDGKKGLDILINGWLHYRKYSKKYCEAVYHRKWLYITEVQDLSGYAGYDLALYEA